MATRDYRIRLPRDVTVKTACEEARCEKWLHGWDTILNESEAAHRELAAWIRSGRSGRDYREMSAPDGGLAIFRFAAHQRCFGEHRTRPALFFAGRSQLPRLGDWIGDFEDHVGALEDAVRRG